VVRKLAETRPNAVQGGFKYDDFCPLDESLFGYVRVEDLVVCRGGFANEWAGGLFVHDINLFNYTKFDPLVVAQFGSAPRDTWDFICPGLPRAPQVADENLIAWIFKPWQPPLGPLQDDDDGYCTDKVSLVFNCHTHQNEPRACSVLRMRKRTCVAFELPQEGGVARFWIHDFNKELCLQRTRPAVFSMFMPKHFAERVLSSCAAAMLGDQRKWRTIEDPNVHCTIHSILVAPAPKAQQGSGQGKRQELGVPMNAGEDAAMRKEFPIQRILDATGFEWLKSLIGRLSSCAHGNVNKLLFISAMCRPGAHLVTGLHFDEYDNFSVQVKSASYAQSCSSSYTACARPPPRIRAVVTYPHTQIAGTKVWWLLDSDQVHYNKR